MSFNFPLMPKASDHQNYFKDSIGEPLVSITILNHNGLSYLKRTIDSILKIDYPNYEIIVVDNGSTDNSVEYIESLGSVRLVRNNINLGFSQGKNIAISQARGEYILSIDNDILIADHQILKKLLKIYSDKVAFIQVPLIDVDSKTTSYYGIYFSLYGLNWHKKHVEIDKILSYPKETIEIAGPTGAFMFFKKKVWDDIGGFDQSQLFHLDDVDIGPRSYLLGYKNFLYTKSFVYNLGGRRSRDEKNYVKRYRFIFSGHARSMIKNYNKKNLFVRFPIFILFQKLKTIKYALKYRDINIVYAFLASIFTFVGKLGETLRERYLIQSRRVVHDDIYLELKTPKFY